MDGHLPPTAARPGTHRLCYPEAPEAPEVEGYNFVTSADVKSQVEEYNYVTSGDVATQISTATQNMVESTDVDTIWKGTQAAYDVIVSESAVSETTLYIIVD